MRGNDIARGNSELRWAEQIVTQVISFEVRSRSGRVIKLEPIVKSIVSVRVQQRPCVAGHPFIDRNSQRRSDVVVRAAGRWAIEGFPLERLAIWKIAVAPICRKISVVEIVEDLQRP